VEVSVAVVVSVMVMAVQSAYDSEQDVDARDL
jgi:hypothetical protein